MKKMPNLRDLLLKDAGLKLLSLLLAFLLWFLVARTLDPSDTITFINVRVNITNADILEAQGKVYEILDNTGIVRVTIKGPKSVTGRLQASDVLAEADVSLLTEDNTIPISLSLNTDDTVDEISANLQAVKVSVETLASKYVPLNSTPLGTVGEGFELGPITLDQNMIEISGPKSAVDRVRYANVDVNVEGVTRSISANMEIELFDANDRQVSLDNLNMQTRYTHVDVIVLATKRVAVHASRTGSPAEGYLYSGSLSISPAMVTLSGSQSALAGIINLTISDPVDITGASESVSKTVDITQYLPEGVTLAATETDTMFTVTVPVEPVSYRTLQIPVSNLTLTEVPETAVLSLDRDAFIEVRFSGLASELEQMTGESVFGEVEVGTYMESEEILRLTEESYEMPVTFTTLGTVKTVQTAYVTVYVLEGQDD